jgi:hypothetical protein
MSMPATRLQSVPLVPTRWCPSCRDYLLEPVVGGLGKMGCCVGCGYTGPLQIDRFTAARSAARRRHAASLRVERCRLESSS